MPGWIGYWYREINKSQMVNNDTLTQALMNMPPYRDGTSQSQPLVSIEERKVPRKAEINLKTNSICSGENQR